MNRIDANLLGRRTVLSAAALGMVGWLSNKTAFSQALIRPEQSGEVLVSLFLRGGMDGLNAIVPHGDDDYYRARPGISIAKNDVVDLDGFFGLNPSLRALYSPFLDGNLAIVHAVGSNDHTRSHFEAMNTMERGLPDLHQNIGSGWIARLLDSRSEPNPSPLRAVAFSNVMPDALRGATGAVAIESLQQFRLQVREDAQQRKLLAKLYETGSDEVSIAGRETLQVLDTLENLNPSSYKPEHGAIYPASDLGAALRQVAFLIKNDIGLEVACLDKGGWDTHVAQGATVGWLSSMLDDLGNSLAAFAKDMGRDLSKVTLVVQTEFGRRAYENSGLGTDHGRASAMLIIGGNVIGGKVFSKWPTLNPAALDGPGDLKVTTDYRSVLGEILKKRLSGVDLATVFPGFDYSELGLIRA